MSKIDDHLNIEEDFFSQDRKSEKKHRRELSCKDRSKYKKTDQEKLGKKSSHLCKKISETFKRGRILAVTPEGMIVDHEDKEYLCTLKGALKKEKTKKKNLVAVGDFVLFEPSEDFTGVIFEIEPRYSVLSRADNLRKNKEQLIAVNIDQLFIVISVVMPKLKPPLVDRYIIAAKQGNMTPIIVLNKIDLLKNPPKDLDEATFKEEVALYHSFISIYKQLDIPIVEVSTVTKEGLEELKNLMKEKASVFSGQSGVGKSTLINCILGTTLKTADIVSRTYKGAHTTTTAQLIPIDHASFCIDTPGIKSFGIWKMNQQDLQNYFYEFQEISRQCRYQNCLHLQEPQCAVKDAVEEGTISAMRYKSYYDLSTLPEDDWR
jgi:ribosome biogenesis GTPase / thiamine phosphate phosphatase